MVNKHYECVGRERGSEEDNEKRWRIRSADTEARRGSTPAEASAFRGEGL